MKNIDLRKVYVCEILKQSEVKLIDDTDILLGKEPKYTWSFEKESKLGLFLKTIFGYKHILTDTIYPLPSKRTGNSYVINPQNTEKLTKKERALCSLLIEQHRSYNVTLSRIRLIEEHINDMQQSKDSMEQ